MTFTIEQDGKTVQIFVDRATRSFQYNGDTFHIDPLSKNVADEAFPEVGKRRLAAQLVKTITHEDRVPARKGKKAHIVTWIETQFVCMGVQFIDEDDRVLWKFSSYGEEDGAPDLTTSSVYAAAIKILMFLEKNGIRCGIEERV